MGKENIDYNQPQKILDIPPVQSISCGGKHILIITINNNDLWSCGLNKSGQLCLGNTENQSKVQQTLFSNITKISAGALHSIFQNDKGEIYACGFNRWGQLGLGHCDRVEQPCIMQNQPPNIIDFCCGESHSLFLDSNGNVFSAGRNEFGSLGYGNSIPNILKQIPDIPPIQTISCVHRSSYLLDLEGNIWSFGGNEFGQLGHGNNLDSHKPTKISVLENIKQISYGSSGYHFLARDSQNKIFVVGLNCDGQLAIKNIESSFSFSKLRKTQKIINTPIHAPKEIDPEYFSIWGDEIQISNKAKSARK